MNNELIPEAMLKEFMADLNPHIWDAWVSFKASKQIPRQEWEVVEFGCINNSLVYKRTVDGYYTEGDDRELYRAGTLIKRQHPLKKVRRLSDSATLEVGKEYEIESRIEMGFKDKVKKFLYNSWGITVVFGEIKEFDLRHITSIVECKEVLFISEDGKQIKHGDGYWYFEEGKVFKEVAHKDHYYSANCRRFSKKELAEEYIPNLSLAMIREGLKANRWDDRCINETIEVIEAGLAKLKNK